MKGRLLGNAARVGALSGLVGLALLVQEAALAYQFGLSTPLAAFQVAFLWISMLWNVLAGGTLVQVLVPTHVWARAQLGAASAADAVAALSAWVIVIMVLLAGAIAVLVPALYASPASGLGSEAGALAGLLFAAMAPTLVLQAVTAVAQARLNVEGRFALAAFTPTFSPIAAAAATIAFGERHGVLAPTLGIIAGQLLQAAVLIVASSGRIVFRLRAMVPLAHLPAVRSFFGSYALVVGAALSLSGVFWFDQAVAARLGAEAIAQLAYANRPVYLFCAFATVAVANVALAGFAENAASRDHAMLEKQLRRGIVLILAGSAVVLPLWGLFAREIVSVLYERGAFSSQDTASVSALQPWAIAQIPFYLVATLAWRILNALRANGIVLAATLGCCAANAVLVVPLAELAGVRGIFAATTVALASWAIVLVVATRRLLRRH